MSISPTSKVEMVVYKTAEVASQAVVFNKCAPVVANAVGLVGQACLDEPSLVVAGAVGAIAIKELGPHVAPYVKAVADPVLATAQHYPKTTVLATSYMCSKLLPIAATGEPISVSAASIACTAAAASLLGYLIKETPQKAKG